MKRVKKIISLFVLVLFSAYYASGVLFFHSHKKDCGQIISHSHLGSNGHSHSANALQLIDHLTNLQVTNSGGLLFSFSPFLFSTDLIFSAYEQTLVYSSFGANLLRAPPYYP